MCLCTYPYFDLATPQKKLLIFRYVFSAIGKQRGMHIQSIIVNNLVHTVLCILYGFFHQDRLRDWGLLAKQLIFKMDSYCQIALQTVYDRHLFSQGLSELTKIKKVDDVQTD